MFGRTRSIGRNDHDDDDDDDDNDDAMAKLNDALQTAIAPARKAAEEVEKHLGSLTDELGKFKDDLGSFKDVDLKSAFGEDGGKAFGELTEGIGKMAKEEIKHKLREMKPDLCKWVQGRMEVALKLLLLKTMPGAPAAAPTLRRLLSRLWCWPSSVAPKPPPPTPAETLAKLQSEVRERLPAAAKELTGAAIDELTGDSSGNLVARFAKLKEELDAKVTTKLQVSTARRSHNARDACGRAL